MAAIYFKSKPLYMNITASVEDEVLYKCRTYGNFNVYEIADSINFTRRKNCIDNPITEKQVRIRLLKLTQRGWIEKVPGSAYYRKLHPPKYGRY